MAYSWEEDSENPSRFKGALTFILTIGFAVGFAMLLGEWLLATPEVGAPVASNVSTVEGWISGIDLVIVAALSAVAFFIGLAFYARDR